MAAKLMQSQRHILSTKKLVFIVFPNFLAPLGQQGVFGFGLLPPVKGDESDADSEAYFWKKLYLFMNFLLFFKHLLASRVVLVMACCRLSRMAEAMRSQRQILRTKKLAFTNFVILF
jgi:hypothetical protein